MASSILVFTIKTIIVVFFVLLLLLILIKLIASTTPQKYKSHLEVTRRQRKLNKLILGVLRNTLKKKERKKWVQQQKELRKKREQQPAKRIYVLNFDGDIKASQTNNFKQEVSMLSSIISNQDQVLLRINSRGGSVTGYGQAAAEFARLKTSGATIIAAIDQVAASGGYLMAAVADKIIAAPFAIVGSIGVAAEVPNLHNFLKKKGVDYQVHTAGKYKRTITVFGKNTAEGLKQFDKDLQITHKLFKDFVKQYRPDVNIDKIATGQWWHAANAKDVMLIDEVITSEDYLNQQSKNYEVFEISYKEKLTWQDKLSASAAALIKTVANSIEDVNNDATLK